MTADHMKTVQIAVPFDLAWMLEALPSWDDKTCCVPDEALRREIEWKFNRMSAADRNPVVDRIRRYREKHPSSRDSPQHMYAEKSYAAASGCLATLIVITAFAVGFLFGKY